MELLWSWYHKHDINDNNVSIKEHVTICDIKIVHFRSINAKSIRLSGCKNNFWMKFRGCSSLNSSLKFLISWASAICISNSAIRRPACQQWLHACHSMVHMTLYRDILLSITCSYYSYKIYNITALWINKPGTSGTYEL